MASVGLSASSMKRLSISRGFCGPDFAYESSRFDSFLVAFSHGDYECDNFSWLVVERV